MSMKLTAEGTFDSNSSPVPPLYVCKDRVMRHDEESGTLARLESGLDENGKS
jgi:hypothetical protein